MKNSNLILGSGLVLSVPLTLAVSGCKTENPRQNIIFILVDDNLGKQTSLLEELGIGDNTVIFFTSDNGGLSTSEGSPTTNYPLRAGKVEITRSGFDDVNTDGISILPLLRSGSVEERPLYWHYPHYSNQGGDPGSAVRSGDFKLIDNFETGRQELYDLKNDISETKDISLEYPEKTRELYDLLSEWRIKTGARMMKINPEWNELQ